jgi:beta-carotene ketolase (CrtO type)
MAMQHEWGVARPVGGMGAFTQALAAEVRAWGGEIRTQSPVRRLSVEGNRVNGVVLAADEEIHADIVIGAIDPTTLFSKLLPEASLPHTVRNELRGLGILRNNASSFRADVALERRPDFIVGAARAAEIAPSVMLFAPDLDYVRRCTNLLGAGEIAPELPVWIGMPSAIDRSLVPLNHGGEGLYVFVPAVPARLRNLQPWADHKDALMHRVLEVLDGYAPGASGTVIDAIAHSPEDLSLFSNVHAGHLFHADMTMAQMGPWRPTPSLSGYRSPIPGLWHTAAGAHPMGTINGWSGRNAARAIKRTR